MATSTVTDQQLEQLENSLPDFLTDLERARLAMTLEVVKRNTLKSTKIMASRGSKRLLAKILQRLRGAEQKLSEQAAAVKVRLGDTDTGSLVKIERVIHGSLQQIESQGDEIEGYLELHEGDETISQIDSYDSAMESVLNRARLANHERSYDQLHVKKAKEESVQDTKPMISQHELPTGIKLEEAVHNRESGQIPGDASATHTEDDDLGDRLHRLRHDFPPQLRASPVETVDQTRHTMQALAKCFERISARAELPPAPIEVFNGDPAEYLFFVKNFRDRVSSKPFSDATKLSHLIEACSGDVKKAMMSYKGQNNGFERALEDLTTNYGQPQQVIDAIIQKLTEGRELKSSDAKALKDFAREIQNGFTLLEEMGMLPEADTQANLKAVFQRLPHRWRVKWSERVCDMEMKGGKPKFKDLVDFVVIQTRKSCHPVFKVENTKQNERLLEDKPRPRGAYGASWPQQEFQPRWQNHATYPEQQRPYAQSPNAPFVSRLPTPPRPSTQQCQVCGREHPVAECPVFAIKDPDTRKKIVLEHRLCFICLGNHLQNVCKKPDAKCSVRNCNGRHHALLHQNWQGQGEYSRKIVTGPQVLLRIIPVCVVGKDGRSISTFAMLDGGSTCSLMDENLATKIGISGTPTTIHLNTIVGACYQNVWISECAIRSTRPPYDEISIPSLYIRRGLPLPDNQTRESVDFGKWNHLKDLPLHERVDYPHVSLLIGEDVPEAHAVLESRYGDDEANEPYAARTRLAWYVAGPTKTRSQGEVVNFMMKVEHLPHQMSTCCDEVAAIKDLDKTVQKLWNEEKLGFGNTTERTLSEDDKEALKILQDTIQLEDNSHYSVGMLWKDPSVKLVNNAAVAYRCLNHLRIQMNKRPAFAVKYKAMIENYIVKGHAQRVPDHEARAAGPKTWYLPHHGVESPSKPDKVRVVFNAASTFHGMSLNGQLRHGPDLNNNLVGTIMRFRLGPVALNADIAEMFHQVFTKPEDSDSLRFLWYPDEHSEKPATYKMTRHIFGAKDSPTACVFALQQCAKDNADSFDQETTETVLRNFYIDDLLKALPSSEAAIQLAQQLIQMLARGGFDLTKFVSNRAEVLAALPEDRVPICKEVNLDTEFDCVTSRRALGLKWDVVADTLGVKVDLTSDNSLTRAGALSFLAGITDPLGFIAPAILIGRLILQDACKRDLKWKETLPEDLRRRFTVWREGLKPLTAFSVPRCFRGLEERQKISGVQLHHFSDASDVGYGTASYLRVSLVDGSVHTTLVFAKARCNPVRQLTTPRAEMQAAVIAARVNQLIVQELELELDEIVFHVDSTIVLQYIRNEDKRFKTYIAARLEEIHDSSTADMWRYCPSKENPADLASRGIPAAKLLRHRLWLTGPEFLLKDPSQWPKDPTTPELPEDDLEVQPIRHISAGTILNRPLIYDLIVSSSVWERTVRKVSGILKFIKFLRAKTGGVPHVIRITTSLQDSEDARDSILRVVQAEVFGKEIDELKKNNPVPMTSSTRKLNPILGPRGVLRVGGRLEHGPFPYNTKHPMILPKGHTVTQSIIRHCHAAVAHSGPEQTLARIRENYWVINGRSTVKAVLSSCIICKRLNATRMEQLMAPLPATRITPYEPPFSVTGADCIGPLIAKRARREIKVYAIIYTCFSTRCVHLEPLPDMTTDSLINANRRFVCRRSSCKEIWCDNGSNLVGGSRELRRSILEWNKEQIHNDLLQRGTEWKFQTPYAPHTSGVWERLVRSVKRSLKAILGNKAVSPDTLHTALIEAEAIVNSRPITQASNDPSDLEALTPAHILVHRKIDSLPPGIFDKGDEFGRRWKQAQFLTNLWWRRWVKEYVPILQMRQKWIRSRRNVNIGELVLLMDESQARGHWPLGRIVKTYPGTDGVARSVDVKTTHGIYKRSLTKLCLLEGANEKTIKSNEP